MAILTIKGYEFNAIAIKDSFIRRSQKFYNNIINTLRSISVTEDDIFMKLEPAAMKKFPATSTWYLDGYRLHYSYNSGNNYVENLFVVSKIIEFEVKQILAGEKTFEQFIFDFSESNEVEEERKEARRFLGVDEDCLDLALITKKYKDLAKKAHPDMSTGDTEQFKILNRAHKILKRELL